MEVIVTKFRMEIAINCLARSVNARDDLDITLNSRIVLGIKELAIQPEYLLISKTRPTCMQSLSGSPLILLWKICYVRPSQRYMKRLVNTGDLDRVWTRTWD